MLAGFVIHNLAMFPQSYPRPDLTHLAPEHVYECGELWALAPGAARLARHAGYVLAGVREAKAILVYVALKPRDTTFLYKTFARAGEPIPWHYITSLDGTPHWAQPMVLEGLALEMTVDVATAVCFESFDDQTLQVSQSVSDRAEDQSKNSATSSQRAGSSRQPRRAVPPLAGFPQLAALAPLQFCHH